MYVNTHVWGTDELIPTHWAPGNRPKSWQAGGTVSKSPLGPGRSLCGWCLSMTMKGTGLQRSGDKDSRAAFSAKLQNANEARSCRWKPPGCGVGGQDVLQACPAPLPETQPQGTVSDTAVWQSEGGEISSFGVTKEFALRLLEGRILKRLKQVGDQAEGRPERRQGQARPGEASPAAATSLDWPQKRLWGPMRSCSPPPLFLCCGHLWPCGPTLFKSFEIWLPGLRPRPPSSSPTLAAAAIPVSYRHEPRSGRASESALRIFRFSPCSAARRALVPRQLPAGRCRKLKCHSCPIWPRPPALSIIRFLTPTAPGFLHHRDLLPLPAESAASESLPRHLCPCAARPRVSLVQSLSLCSLTLFPLALPSCPSAAVATGPHRASEQT